MSFQLIPHTSELKIKIQAKTLEGLFKTAFTALFKILKPQKCDTRKTTERNLSVTGADRTSLLVNFLSDLLALAQIHKEAYTDLHIKNLTDTSLRAEFRGYGVNKFLTDIKAVTYHSAEIVKNSKGFLETTVIFDI